VSGVSSGNNTTWDAFEEKMMDAPEDAAETAKSKK
jgi:hypothetical protein